MLRRWRRCLFKSLLLCLSHPHPQHHGVVFIHVLHATLVSVRVGLSWRDGQAPGPALRPTRRSVNSVVGVAFCRAFTSLCFFSVLPTFIIHSSPSLFLFSRRPGSQSFCSALLLFLALSLSIHPHYLHLLLYSFFPFLLSPSVLVFFLYILCSFSFLFFLTSISS